MKRVLFYCFTFAALSSFVSNNRSNFRDLLKSKLRTYTTQNWPEKVYVHTDKPFYTLGEDLWFSTYLVNGISHEASTKSKVVYVELIDDSDSIVSSKRLYIDDLSTEGHFKIENNWPSGNYLLRAYTNYMRNEQPEIFFQKIIKVVSLDSSFNAPESNTSAHDDKLPLGLKKPNLEFFPEGGHLVENINSKVAIKIKDPLYQNYSLPIEIVNSQGTVMSKLTSLEFGLGFFHLTPLPDENYFAKLNLNGQVHQYPLPKALTEGYSLNINFRDDALLIGINSSKEEGLRNSYLMIHQRGKVLFDKVNSGRVASDLISIYTGTLKDGVTHITMFNTLGQPVCERLVYLDNSQNNVSVLIKNNKNEFQSREKVTLALQIQNSQNLNETGNLSMSVRDLGVFPQQDNGSNIKTWLLLNSDLRGKIDDPGYFFSEGEAAKKKFLLDLIMMTNGWRRFSWQNMLQNSEPKEPFNIEKGICITGTTRMLEPPNNEVKTVNTITFMGEDSFGMESVTSKNDGKFSFGPYVFYDSIQTLIQSRLVDVDIKTQDNYRDVLISMDKEGQSIPDVINPEKGSSSPNSNALNDDFLEAAEYMKTLRLQYNEDRELLDEIVLTATKQTKEEERQEEMEERSFFGGSSQRIDVESDPFLSKTDVSLIFQRFPGVRVGARDLFYRGQPCRILFNNMAVDLDFIRSLNPSNFSFIDFYGPNNSVYNLTKTPGGAFVIYGKLGVNGSTKSNSREPGIINFASKGFDLAKEFYAPDYSKDLDQMTRTDVRTTLHWEPKIQLNGEQNSAELSFYTCDMKGDYIIEIEGITDSGIPIHEIAYFSVN